MSRLGESPVEFAGPAVVSAVTRQGIPELLAWLREQMEQVPAGPEADAFRMPIDRVFALAGVGTVVTGTPWSGALRIGDQVRILPEGTGARVRSLEAYGEAISETAPRARTAIGLAGTDRAAAGRGDVLVGGTIPWQATSALDVRIELLAGAAPLRRRSRVRVHLGTAEVLGRLYPRPEILPGSAGPARIALERPLVARGGDRFVLRSYSPVETLGGGVVLDPIPPRRASWPEGLEDPAPAARLSALIARRPRGAELRELPLLLGVPEEMARRIAEELRNVSLVGSRLIAKSTTTALREAALRKVADYHAREPSERGMSLETLRKSLRAPAEVADTILQGMARRGELTAGEGVISIPGFVPRLVAGEVALVQVVSLLDAAGLEPPTVDELERQTGLSGLLTVLRFAAREGRVVAVEPNRFFSSSVLTGFLTVVREIGTSGPLTPPMVRERTGLSRKFLIPLLEYADRAGVTRRVGDARVII
jgi:selenocysteine-specific elongation factor